MNQLYRRLILAAIPVGLCLTMQAQKSFGGQPFGLMPHLKGSIPEAPVVALPPASGAARTVDLGLDNSGVWHTMPNGDHLWRLALEMPGASAIGLGFTEYEVPYGALVFVYNATGGQQGAFMAASSPGKATFEVVAPPGERITVEYYEPVAVAGEGRLRIGLVDDGPVVMGGGGCPVVPPAGVDMMHPAYEGTISLEPACCTVAWDDVCQSIYDMLFPQFCVPPPPDVDTNSPEYQMVITTLPECCSVEWSVACQQLYENPGTCTVVPPADVDILSMAYMTTLGEMPSCCYVAWTDDCQELYESHIPNCTVVPPADVDTESILYQGLIFAYPECCDTEWSEICQVMWDILNGVLPTCVEPPSHVDPNSEAYWAVISDMPECCMVEWSDACQAFFEENGGPVPIPNLDAAVTSIVGVSDLVCGTDHVTPQITIKNNGTDVITSVVIVYGIQGEAPQLDVWNGSLLYLQTANHTLPPLPILSHEQTLVVATNAPNGLEDEVPGNDSWTQTLFGSVPADTVYLHLTLDDWGSDITWTLHSEGGTLLYSGGPYADGIGDQTITIPWCLTSGCFTFTIHDSFGDGICCGAGNGGYVIANGHGYTFAENDGQYGFMSTDGICISEIGVAEIDAAGTMGVYPNPTTGTITVALQGTTGRTWLRLMDATGRLVEERAIMGGPAVSQVLDMSALRHGIYMLVAEHDGGRLVQRVVLQR